MHGEVVVVVCFTVLGGTARAHRTPAQQRAGFPGTNIEKGSRVAIEVCKAHRPCGHCLVPEPVCGMYVRSDQSLCCALASQLLLHTGHVTPL